MIPHSERAPETAGETDETRKPIHVTNHPPATAGLALAFRGSGPTAQDHR